jgi:hypothetical protein
MWLDVAMVTSIFAVGSILFGRFEQHKPRWRRLLKMLIVIGIFLGTAATAGRAWELGLLALSIVGAGVVHLWWLPKHGINGWTAEPYDKYLALVTRHAGRAAPPTT